MECNKNFTFWFYIFLGLHYRKLGYAYVLYPKIDGINISSKYSWILVPLVLSNLFQDLFFFWVDGQRDANFLNDDAFNPTNSWFIPSTFHPILMHHARPFCLFICRVVNGHLPVFQSEFLHRNCCRCQYSRIFWGQKVLYPSSIRWVCVYRCLGKLTLP